jgi:Gluconate 2-dehydrogenase subunit 3
MKKPDTPPMVRERDTGSSAVARRRSPLSRHAYPPLGPHHRRHCREWHARRAASTDHTRLAWASAHLSHDEAEFVDAAFRCILSEGEGNDPPRALPYAHYLDRKLVTPLHGSEPAPTPLALLYRNGIAAVQAHCISTHGQRFQRLPVWRQCAVLAVMEDGSSREAMGALRELFFAMVNDAAEAYFDCHSPSFRSELANVSDQRVPQR